MGDVDAMRRSARRRRVGGLIMLAAATVAGVVLWYGYRYQPDLVVLDLGGPLAGVAFCLAFVAGALPLLVPQRVPPPDIRHNRWYIACGLWATSLQLVLVGCVATDFQTLARSLDGERAVVVYDADTANACLRVWSGRGAVARVVGEIGAPGGLTRAYFQSRDTVILTADGSGLLPTLSTMIRLDPRSGRPLDHTRRPCPPATGRPSR